MAKYCSIGSFMDNMLGVSASGNGRDEDDNGRRRRRQDDQRFPRDATFVWEYKCSTCPAFVLIENLKKMKPAHRVVVSDFTGIPYEAVPIHVCENCYVEFSGMSLRQNDTRYHATLAMHFEEPQRRARWEEAGDNSQLSLQETPIRRPRQPPPDAPAVNRRLSRSGGQAPRRFDRGFQAPAAAGRMSHGGARPKNLQALMMTPGDQATPDARPVRRATPPPPLSGADRPDVSNAVDRIVRSLNMLYNNRARHTSTPRRGGHQDEETESDVDTEE